MIFWTALLKLAFTVHTVKYCIVLILYTVNMQMLLCHLVTHGTATESHRLDLWADDWKSRSEKCQLFHTSDGCVMQSAVFSNVQWTVVCPVCCILWLNTSFLPCLWSLLKLNIYLPLFPVLLVLLLPNVGTRLQEATSPSLVVRQTPVLYCNHINT